MKDSYLECEDWRDLNVNRTTYNLSSIKNNTQKQKAWQFFIHTHTNGLSHDTTGSLKLLSARNREQASASLDCPDTYHVSKSIK